MDGGDVDPVGVGLEGVFDLGSVHADIVVVVLAGERMYAVGAQRNVVSSAGGGAAYAVLKLDEPALDLRLVSRLDVIARATGISTHGTAVLCRHLPVFHHGFKDEGGEVALLLVDHALDAGLVVVGDIDCRVGHDLVRGRFNRVSLDHLNTPTRLLSLVGHRLHRRSAIHRASRW